MSFQSFIVAYSYTHTHIHVHQTFIVAYSYTHTHTHVHQTDIYIYLVPQFDFPHHGGRGGDKGIGRNFGALVEEVGDLSVAGPCFVCLCVRESVCA